MPVIKPISDLRNYNQVLEKVSVGSPVYLTKMVMVVIPLWISMNRRKCMKKQ